MKNKNRILVVDDENDICTMLMLRLEKAGLEVDCANDGFEALEKIDIFKPDLILMDVVMPSIDGWNVCKKIKENPATKNILVYIITSAVIVDEDLITAVGADGYFTKPFEEPAMIEKIKELLSI